MPRDPFSSITSAARRGDQTVRRHPQLACRRMDRGGAHAGPWALSDVAALKGQGNQLLHPVWATSTPTSSCERRTTVAQLQHVPQDMPTAGQLRVYGPNIAEPPASTADSHCRSSSIKGHAATPRLTIMRPYMPVIAPASRRRMSAAGTMHRPPRRLPQPAHSAPDAPQHWQSHLISRVVEHDDIHSTPSGRGRPAPIRGCQPPGPWPKGEQPSECFTASGRGARRVIGIHNRH